MGAEREGIQEGGLSPPWLLTKGILYNLPDNPKVTWLHHCPTLPLPEGPAPDLEPRDSSLGLDNWIS